MTLAWPLTLPQDILIGETQTFNDEVVLATQMETGPDHLRLRDTVQFGTYQAQLMLSDAQREIMKTFWLSDSKRGTIPFEWHDPYTGATKNYRLRACTFTNAAPWNYCQITLEEVPV